MTDRHEFIHAPDCSLRLDHKGDCRAADGSWSRGEWRPAPSDPTMLLWLCACGWYGQQPEKTPAGERYCPECHSRAVKRVEVQRVA